MHPSSTAATAPSYILERRGGALVASLTCERMDRQHSDALLRGVCAAALQPPRLPLIIDLSAVGLIPSPAQGALIEIRNLLKQTGQRLILVGLQEKVAATFALARLNKLFDLLPDLDQALSAVQKASGTQFR